MKTKLVLTAAALAALVLTGGASSATVQGPATFAGHGYFGADLEMAAPGDSRPIVIAGTRGYVGVLDVGGDARVDCSGHGRAAKTATRQGTVWFCKGLRGVMKIVGSHVRFRGHLARYLIKLPEGVSGDFHGQRPGRSGRPQADREPVRDGERERPAPPADPTDE